MTVQQFSISYILPFIIVFVAMAFNEYRLYKAEKINYESYINGIAMLLMSLLSFMFFQVIVSKIF